MHDELAALLTRLRRENRQQSGLSAELVPPDAAAGYRTAGMVAQQLEWPVGGWKIAAVKKEMQKSLRTDGPIYGRVYKQFIRESPVTLQWATLLRPIVEIEYAVRLAADLPSRERPYTRKDIAAAVASIHPGLEIAECRFTHDEAFPPLPAILADGSGSGSIIVGTAIADWRTCDIASQDAVLRVNGVERRRGTAAAAVDHPLIPLTWLANELSRTGVGMKAGEVISTGTLTGMVLAKAGEEHVADYGPFGEVCVRFA